MMLAAWSAAVLLFVVLWLVLADLVSLVLPESVADMGLTLLPVFCSRTVLSLLLMAYSRLELSLLVSLNYSRADWLVHPAHLLSLQISFILQINFVSL